jgi:uncharacterized protein YcbK (DUF882 family)
MLGKRSIDSTTCTARTLAATLLVLLMGGIFAEGTAEAKVVPGASATTAAGSKPAAKRRGGRFNGRNTLETELRKAPTPRPSGHVVISSPAFREQVDVNIYEEDGSLDQEALAQLDHLFRCRSTGEERAMDPRLYEILSLVYDHFGRPLEINSGFRYQRNEGSRHFHGSAMDVTIPKVSYRDVFAYVSTLDRGGMGIGRYPIGGFVHIDFRAPGEPGYRWVDSHGQSSDPGKMPSKMWKRSSKPNT